MDSPSQSQPAGRFIRIILPVILVVAAVAVGALMLKFRFAPEELPIRREAPRVVVMDAVVRDIPVTILSQGHVQPHTSTTLLSEISGIVEFVSPLLREGSFFPKGEVLLRIEPTEYRAALAEMERNLAAADVIYQEEKARAAQAREDWNRRQDAPAGDLTLRLPQLRRAETELWAAEAAVAVARRNLQKTELRAPYDGRVKQRLADLGQSLVARNSPVAEIYATDAAEIRAMLPLSDLRFLDVAQSPTASHAGTDAQVRVIRRDGPVLREWSGSLSRIGGAIDPATRQVPVIITVQDPFGLLPDSTVLSPLLAGSFVEVEIYGKQVESIVELPRLALRPGNTLYLLNEADQLEIRAVSVLRQQGDLVWIDAGLEGGERVILTPLATVVPGMVLSAAEKSPGMP